MIRIRLHHRWNLALLLLQLQGVPVITPPELGAAPLCRPFETCFYDR